MRTAIFVLLAASTASALRPDDPRSTDLYQYESTDVVLHFDTPDGHFRIHYTVAGKNAVEAEDRDSNQLPDFVDYAADAYEQAWDHYHRELGFREPLLAPGETRFAVYLLDFGGSGDGAFREEVCGTENPDQCSGFMVQENDFAGYGYPSIRDAILILASHEYFHAIQAAYDAHEGSVWAEGTAVWATENFAGRLDDFEGFIGGYLHNPARSLDDPLPGPVDPFSYGSAIFFRFLEEKFGATTLRELWEHCVNGADGVADPKWMDALDVVLRPHDSSFAAAFSEFGEWNLRVGTWADRTLSYRNGATYDELRMDAGTLPLSEEKVRVFHASTQYTTLALGGRTQLTAALVPAAGATLEGLVLKLALRVPPHETRITTMTDPAAGTQIVEATGAAQAIAIVVNTTRTGTSLRPSVCVGTPAEVAACVTALTPKTPDPVPDPDPKPVATDPPVEDAGGCATAGAGAWLLAGLIARRRANR